MGLHGDNDNKEIMFRTILTVASLVGAAAFAPVSQVARSSALKMSFESELGAQPPLGFWDPLGFLPRPTKKDSTDLELSKPSTEESLCLPSLDTSSPLLVSVFLLDQTKSRLVLPSLTLAQPLVLPSPSLPLALSSLDLLPSRR